MEPLQIGPISNLDELEVKTLQFQNQKLGMRLNQRLQIEDDLRQRIDQLEKRQTQDDAVINVIHRYWNQLNEDVRILLQRFDAETGDESEKDNEHESTKSFLSQLATWHKQELDEKLANRVQVSQRAVAKIIQVFDHMMQRNEKVSQAIHRQVPSENSNTQEGTATSEDGDKAGGDKEGGVKVKVKEEVVVKEEVEDGGGAETTATVKSGSGEEKEKDDKDAVAAAATAGSGPGDSKEKSKAESGGGKSKLAAAAVSGPPVSLDAAVKEMNLQLQRENKALHQLNTSLHEKNHFLSLKEAEFEERIFAETTKNEELQNKCDDLEYELTKYRMKNGKLETSLIETQETLKMYVDKDGGKLENKVVLSNAERKSVEQLSQDLEEQRELASNRLMELEVTNGKYKDTLKEVEKLKMELSTLPEHVVVETTEHKCLQSQFSVLYNEAMQLKTQLEDARNQLQVAKNAHIRQIEQMEAEELLAQKKLRAEAIQLEDMLAQVRKEYEMLRIEFEQNLAANEQTGPINKEMRNLITSLQTHNVQLKGGVGRYKRRLKEANTDLGKVRKELDDYKTAEIKALQAKKEKMNALNSNNDANDSSDDVIEVLPSGEATTVSASGGAGGATAAAAGTGGGESSGASPAEMTDAAADVNGKIRNPEMSAVDASVDQPTAGSVEDASGDSPDSSVAAGGGAATPNKAGTAPGTPVATPSKKRRRCGCGGSGCCSSGSSQRSSKGRCGQGHREGAEGQAG